VPGLWVQEELKPWTRPSSISTKYPQDTFKQNVWDFSAPKEYYKKGLNIPKL